MQGDARIPLHIFMQIPIRRTPSIEPERSGGEMEALRTVPEEQRATAAPRPEGYFSRGGVPEGTLWKKASPACGFRMQKL